MHSKERKIKNIPLQSSFIVENTARVNKIITVLMSVIFAASFVLNLTNFIEMPGGVMGSLILELSIAAILVVKTKKHTLTMAILFMSILTFTVAYVGGEHTGMIIATVLCVISLYLNKTILFSFGGLYGIAFTANYYTTHHNFNTEYISIMVFLALIVVVLYFVCKRSTDLIEISHKNESDANNMVNSIQENTAQLHSNINHCNKDIRILRDISDVMAMKIKDVADDVAIQSDSIKDINRMINIADAEMSEINQMSNDLAETAENASQALEESSKQFSQMDKQTQVINLTVSESLLTIKALDSSMDQVNGFLSMISQIASETNLLALNASIEAARAGSAGSGFSVVAAQIKQLAEQSAHAVEDINYIVQDIQAKTQAVFHTATAGDVAVKEGELITKQVLNSFEDIRGAFKKINYYIRNELNKVDHVSGVFSQVRGQSENISTISQKHLTTTNEMLDVTKEQYESIEVIYSSISSINDSSICLQELIEKR